MVEDLFSDKEIGLIKLERSKRLALVFDQLDEFQVRNLLSSLAQSMYKLKIFNEDYYLINKLLSMNIKKYGGIIKAFSWKEGYIITKARIMSIIQRIEESI